MLGIGVGEVGVALRRFCTPHSACERATVISRNTPLMKPLWAASAIASSKAASHFSNCSTVVAASAW